jgi:cytochrome c-type biogenesis protein CcmE
MHPLRKRKLTLILLILCVGSLALGLVLFALRQNISLFYTPTQIHAGEAPLNRLIRVGGMVKKGSVLRGQNGLEVQFRVQDLSHHLIIHYQGILPDLFREGQGVVAEGTLIDNKHFQALRVLAKHDENYMPPEVRSALEKAKP